MCHSHVIPCCFPFSLSVTCLLGTTSSTSKCLQRPLFCCLRLYMFAHVTVHLQPCTLVALIETQHHKVKPSVASVMSDSATLWNVARQAPLSVHGDSPGKNTAVGCHFLLQSRDQRGSLTKCQDPPGPLFTCCFLGLSLNLAPCMKFFCYDFLPKQPPPFGHCYGGHCLHCMRYCSNPQSAYSLSPRPSSWPGLKSTRLGNLVFYLSWVPETQPEADMCLRVPCILVVRRGASER